ncbi:hypothetical protein [Cupriavidus sp. CP313]
MRDDLTNKEMDHAVEATEARTQVVVQLKATQPREYEAMVFNNHHPVGSKFVTRLPDGSVPTIQVMEPARVVNGRVVFRAKIAPGEFLWLVCINIDERFEPLD